jgi:hypothetical protein
MSASDIDMGGAAPTELYDDESTLCRCERACYHEHD